MRKFKNRSLGFTLIELLVVIIIIGILSSFLFANFVGIRQRSRDGVRKSDLRQIQSALELYRADQGTYPTNMTLSCGCAITNSPTEPYVICSPSNAVTIYLQKIPCDPSTSTTPYYYASQGNPIGSGMSAYGLVACLENENDSQKDSMLASGCTTASSYTVRNP